MLEEELKYVLNFVESVKDEILRSKYNSNTELYLQALRSERYISKELKELQESKVKNEWLRKLLWIS